MKKSPPGVGNVSVTVLTEQEVASEPGLNRLLSILPKAQSAVLWGSIKTNAEVQEFNTMEAVWKDLAKIMGSSLRQAEQGMVNYCQKQNKNLKK